MNIFTFKLKNRRKIITEIQLEYYTEYNYYPTDDQMFLKILTINLFNIYYSTLHFSSKQFLL